MQSSYSSHCAPYARILVCSDEWSCFALQHITCQLCSADNPTLSRIITLMFWQYWQIVTVTMSQWQIVSKRFRAIQEHNRDKLSHCQSGMLTALLQGMPKQETILNREAWTRVGGLSEPSKMPCHGYSIPANTCKLGSMLAKVKGTTCNGCYALKGRYVMPTVREALNRRFASLGSGALYGKTRFK